MRRLAAGLMGATRIFSAVTCPDSRQLLGTIEAPSPMATRLFIVSTLSNSMTGFGGGPASASHSVTVRRSADSSLPRIRGHRDINDGVTFFGIGPMLVGRIATR